MPKVEDIYEGVHGEASRRLLGRGEFLRLALGAGAGMALSGSLGAFGAGGARAADMLGGEFPIGAWWPPPPNQTTVERYREIKDAGFNFVIGGNGVANDVNNAKALEAAAGNDVRLVLTDYDLHQRIRGVSGARAAQSAADGAGGSSGSPMRSLLAEDELRVMGEGAFDGSRIASSADLREEIRQRVIALLDAHGGSPALSGVNLYDEPGAGLFGNVSFAKSVLSARAVGLLPYVNTPPSHAAPSMLGVRDYPTYLARYMAEIQPPVLSFDHYPLLAGRAITRDYFHNWSLIRRHSLRTGVPSWVFIQSVDFDGRNVGLAPRRRPSRADLLWQINVSLAYGAKGVQYFTYWTPENGAAGFGQALISKSGTRTPLYGHAQSVNSYLRSMGKALLPLRSDDVVHARAKPLFGAAPFRPDAFARSVAGGPVILGWFRKPGAGAKVRYLLVVNASAFATATSTITMSPHVAGIFNYAVADERFVPVRRPPRQTGPRRITFRLGPGEARLFRLRRR